MKSIQLKLQSYSSALLLVFAGLCIFSSTCQPPYMGTFNPNPVPMAPGLPGGQGGLSSFPNMQVSQAEIDALYNYLQNLDDKELEELEKLSKQMLTDMGFDPETLKPIAPSAPVAKPDTLMPPPIPPTQTTPLPVQPPVNVSKQSVQMASTVIPSLLTHLTTLRNKALSDTFVGNSLKSWLTDLSDLIYLLNIMNKPVHYTRLATPEFDQLIKMLSRLDSALETYEEHLISCQPEGESDYDLLGIKQSATPDDIENAYSKIKQKYEKQSPDRPTVLGFEFITEAYDRLKDPKSRALVDKELAELCKFQESTHITLSQALAAITGALSAAIYHDQVINLIEQFFKKYEPQELALRKHLEEAETQRLKELKEYSRLEPKGRTIHVGKSRDRYDFGGNFGVQPNPYGAPGSYGGYAGTPYQPSSYNQPYSPDRFDTGNFNRPSSGKNQSDQSGDKSETDAGSSSDTQQTGKLSLSRDHRPDQDSKKTSSDSVTHHIGQLQSDISRFNTKMEKKKKFFENLILEPAKPEIVAKEIQDLENKTNFSRMADDSETLSDIIKKADKRKQAQYKELWQASNKDRTEFESNINLMNQSLKPYKSEKKGAEKDQNGKQATPASILDTLAGALEDIKENLNGINSSLGLQPQGTYRPFAGMNRPL